MKTLNYFGLLTLLLCHVACSKSNESEEPTPTPTPPPSAPTITIDNTLITNGLSFTDGASEKSITFTTDADWTLSVAETRAVDWCTPSATSGVKGTVTVKFSVTENTGYDNRKAAVTIKAGSTSKTFTVSQKQKDALLITTDKYELEQAGGEIEVEVKANIDYQIKIAEDSKSWISESTTRALTSHKHAFVISASEEYDKREGEIRVISGDKEEIIKVYQSGGAILLLSQNEYVVSDAGETISIEVKSNFEFGIQMPEVDWISEATDTRAASSHTIKYDIAPNETYDSRSAEIIFVDKNSDIKEVVKIEQVQKDALILSKSKYTIPSEGETIEVVLQSNVKFDISIDADWISQVDAPATRGMEEHKLYFKVEENSLKEERSANITITDTNKDLSQIIEVTQVKAEERHALMVDGSTFNQTLEELSGNLSNIKSIDFIVNYESEPTTDYVLLSTSDSDVPIYATYNDGEVRIFTIGNCFEFNSDCSSMFSELYYVTSINFGNNIDTSSVTNMSSMFYSCYCSLTSLDVSNFDTSNVTNMSSMFGGCSELTSLDVSNFDTSSVTNMSSMFGDCSELTSLDLSNFDTSNVTNMSGMFYRCLNLTSIDLSSFDTSSVTDMSFMFWYCESLTSLDVSSFNTSNVTNMELMFGCCSALTSFDVSNFNTSSVTNMSHMFVECYALTSLDLSNFNTSSVTNMSLMFFGCNALTSLDLSNFNTSSVTNMYQMFYGCSALTSLDLSSFNTSSVTDMSSMFGGCYALTSLDLSSFNTSNVRDMYGMFQGCKALTSLDLSSFNTLSVINMHQMFYGCSALTSLDLSSFNTSSVTDMSYMFTSCESLTSLDLSSFVFRGYVTHMFEGLGMYATNKPIPVYVKDGATKTWLERKDTRINSQYAEIQVK